MISFQGHRKYTHQTRQGKPRSHHQKKGSSHVPSEYGERSGVMVSHHGCDMHKKSRTCVACFNDYPQRGRFAGSAGCGTSLWSEEKLQNTEWIECRDDGKSVVYVDYDTSVIYREITRRQEQWWFDDDEWW